MPIAPAKFVPHEMKVTVVKIFSYEKKNPIGLLVNSYFGRDVYFDSTIQLLHLIDEIQDGLSFPQKSMVLRALTDKSSAAYASKDDLGLVFKGINPIASFKVSVIFRQNASWQGSVVWLDKNLQTEFRSALELLYMIDAVLEPAEDGTVLGEDVSEYS